MAKALFGAVSDADIRSLDLLRQVRTLRGRVAELESQLDRACRANDELHAQLRASAPTELVLDDSLLHLESEPALT